MFHYSKHLWNYNCKKDFWGTTCRQYMQSEAEWLKSTIQFSHRMSFKSCPLFDSIFKFLLPHCFRNKKFPKWPNSVFLCLRETCWVKISYSCMIKTSLKLTCLKTVKHILHQDCFIYKKMSRKKLYLLTCLETNLFFTPN